MIRVAAIHIAPVKSLGLAHPSTVEVGPRGIVEDRRFYLIGQGGRLVTQREMGCLVRVKAEYTEASQRLGLQFPSGDGLEGPVELGPAVKTRIWGRSVEGRLVEGDWSAALSEFCGAPVSLVFSDQPGQCYDEFPISILSQESLERLGQQAGGGSTFDSLRFRPNFLLEGCQPHEEDSWLTRTIRIGQKLRILLTAADPRCAITTQDPLTGKPDVDTLSLIRGYRSDPRTAYFGVYGVVEHPGPVLVGDVVTPL